MRTTVPFALDRASRGKARVLTVFECAPCQPPKKSRTKAARPSFDRVAKGVLKPLAEGQLSQGGDRPSMTAWRTLSTMPRGPGRHKSPQMPADERKLRQLRLMSA